MSTLVLVGPELARLYLEKEAGMTRNKANPLPFAGGLLAMKISPNFTWGEVFTKRTQRQILSVLGQKEDILTNAANLAREMEKVRARLGNMPIEVTSWYRDPVSNKSNGGAPKSQHLLGKAVDFNVAGMTPDQVQRACEWWPGGMGYGLAFTHLDTRPERRRFRY